MQKILIKTAEINKFPMRDMQIKFLPSAAMRNDINQSLFECHKSVSKKKKLESFNIYKLQEG